MSKAPVTKRRKSKRIEAVSSHDSERYSTPENASSYNEQMTSISTIQGATQCFNPTAIGDGREAFQLSPLSEKLSNTDNDTVVGYLLEHCVYSVQVLRS